MVTLNHPTISATKITVIVTKTIAGVFPAFEQPAFFIDDNRPQCLRSAEITLSRFETDDFPGQTDFPEVMFTQISDLAAAFLRGLIAGHRGRSIVNPVSGLFGQFPDKFPYFRDSHYNGSWDTKSNTGEIKTK
ncbi:MAG: hypothetical protein IIZ41_05465 [Lachnospiraceae bacterium]|nr:hypothetical protein [Lachnospiraceae bacterium]